MTKLNQNKSIEEMIQRLKKVANNETFDDMASEILDQIYESDMDDEKKISYNSQISQMRKDRENGVKIKGYNLAQRFFMKHPRVAISAGALFLAGTVGIISTSVTGCGNDKDEPANIQVETTNEVDSIETPEVTTKPEVVTQENVVSPTLWFDANDNESLIEQSVKFVAESRAYGIDFASEDEISKYMDLYLVANLEQIDPMDYARMNYYHKTTQSVIDNYQQCINEISYDLLTVTPDTMLSYDFVADKDSKEVLEQFQELIARYNVAKTSSERTEIEEEMETFLMEKFVEVDGREYTRATYEMIARFSLIADEILPHGLSEDITSILSEDLYDCDMVTPDGEKQKSERAQAETSLREMIEEKLTIMREYRGQDLTGLSESELLTGVQVEMEILAQVQEMNIEFVENPDLTAEAEQSYVASTPVATQAPSVELSNGEEIAVEEVEELGLDPDIVTPETYQEAKEQQFEAAAQADPNHNIKDNDGNVMVSGEAVNAEEYNSGFAAGYAAGNSYLPCSPSGSASYVAGYKEGHAMGLADRQAVDAKVSGSTTHYESTQATVVGSSESVIEQGYTGNATPTPTPTPTPAPTPTPNPDVETNTEFVPVDGVIIESTEEIEEEGYIEVTTVFEPVASNASRIQQLEQLKAMAIAAQMATPTVTFYGNDAVLAYGGEQYELTGHSMKA